MDVNVSTDVKGIGVAVTPTVEREDRVKPAVAPVAADSESTKASLGDKELHGKESQKQLDAEDLAKAVEEIQKQYDSMGGTRLNFSLMEEPDAVVVQVTDRDSGELIKQFPSDEVLALRKKLEELSGLLFDDLA